ncbi:MAG: ankyrin repeat domain-containing protein [Candidatus Omnitrophica bacterium]|nr:ankyrin repeat domain-containing protein [Candidatus Omnitrophota bacterium]
MIRPEELRKNKPLMWSPGTGTDVWAMFCAAIAGDLETIKRLLDKDPSLVRCNYAYRTPLYFAVRENQVDAAAYLLEHGADPIGLAVHDSFLDIARDHGYAAMQKLLEATLASVHNASPNGNAIAAAIRERDLARVRGLLDASPGLLHAGDERSNQPIHWAAMTRQIDMIDELLARGADINAARFDGARPMQLTNGDYHYRGWRDVPKDVTTTPAEVLAHLRARGAYVDICTAAHIGDLDRVKELLDEEPALANRVSDYVTYYVGSGSPLRNAAAKGHIEIVKLLLDRGADPNLREEGIAPHGHALYSAVYNGHFETAKLLLEHGAYANPAVESSADALSIAIRKSDQRMIELLASYGGARSVDLLACYGDVREAAAVFAANPALADNPEALANAAADGHEAFVRLMLRYQPDLAKRFQPNPRSGTVGAKTRESTELLFEHGMNPSQPDWLRTTPLHHFARKGDVEMAAIFIDHGADLHARDEDICSTPLGWAAKFGKTLMVELLLRRTCSGLWRRIQSAMVSCPGTSPRWPARSSRRRSARAWSVCESSSITRFGERSDDGCQCSAASACENSLITRFGWWPAQTASAREKQMGLVLAALNGKAKALATLIGLGVDQNAPSPDLYSHANPLHHAVCSGSLDAVKVLVEAGAELGTRDKAENATPLGWAEYYQGERERDERGQRYAEIAAYLREKEGHR